MKTGILLFLLCGSLTLAAQQEEDNTSKLFGRTYIRKGQKLYTENSKQVRGLSPVHYEIRKTVGGQVQRVIVDGDYETIDTNRVTSRGDYVTYTTTITGTDTTYSTKKKELHKEAAILLRIHLQQKDEKINVQLANGILPNTATDTTIDPHSGSQSMINSLDNNASFYWKLEPGEQFAYHQLALVGGAVSLPFKIRFKNSKGPSTVETALTNVALYIGPRWSHYRYKQSEFRSFKFTATPFVGPASIKLDSANTSGVRKSETNRLGITTGAAALFSSGNLSIGIATGADFLTGSYKKDWVYHKKLWIGFAVGYKVAFL